MRNDTFIWGLLIGLLLFVGGIFTKPAEWFILRGCYYEYLGKNDQALPNYIQAFHFGPRYIKKFYQQRGSKAHIDTVLYITDYLDVLNTTATQKDWPKERSPRRLSKLIEQEQNDPGLYYQRGRIFYARGDFKKARRDFAKALELDPSFAPAWYMMALTDLARGNKQKALENITLALRYDSRNPYAYYVRGMVNKMNGKHRQAIDDLTLAIAHKNDFVQAYYQRAHFQYTLVDGKQGGDIDAAINDYTTAITLDPDNEQYYFSRGAAYARFKNDHQQAIRDFTRALDIKPDRGLFYYNRAKAYYQLKEYQKSSDDMKKAEQFGFKVEGDFMKEEK